ncbi:hypothetical protein NJT12_08645 [Flavobacterium sp. AC]|uniref:Uncharacterized protein n=1 Tax=Flavobacterium azizsancarii TaxID=2961580 RepID=A0ABT4WB33_9FLAO|nr:hypothetical protein [Flavobacterium azizsancarii]MDA6069686.1 hypothetical protein [Flavobacterium azizsancarii]
MKKYILLAFLSFYYFSNAQSIQSVDSLTTEICKSLIQNKNLNNEIRINTINNSHITPYLAKFNDSLVQKKAFELIFYRLQKNCNEFVALFPNKAEERTWSMQEEKPVEKIAKAKCNQFDKTSKYYYIENDGNKVAVTLKDNLWTEQFSDNTFSKLHYRKKGNCEFELEFIESNNISRGNLSIKGDKYLYKIYDEENETYSLYTKNKETYYIFKIVKE